MTSLDRNACIGIDISGYFMHRRIGQTPCQTSLGACISPLSAGHGHLCFLIEWLFLLSNITGILYDWLLKKSQEKCCMLQEPPQSGLQCLAHTVPWLSSFGISYKAHPWEALAANTWVWRCSLFIFFSFRVRWFLTGFLSTPSRGPR